MTAASAKPPRLRSLDVVRVKTARGMATMLRDGEGIGDPVVVHPPLDAALDHLDGRQSIADVAARIGVSVALIRGLAEMLDAAFLLANARSDARRRELVAAFLASSVREATHAGGAYHGEADALGRFIDDECLGGPAFVSEADGPVEPALEAEGSLVGLVAPHMDLWRAKDGYGSAYRALRARLDPRVDTFVLLGTCHAGMARPFALSRKRFATPLGELAPDDDAIDALATACTFDAFADEYAHKGEHSIEFQAVFVRHVIGDARARGARIVPILCGLGRAQALRGDPSKDRDAESFLRALADVVGERAGRVAVIAGADLAHVGPRFGDPRPSNVEERARLEARDRASIERAASGDALGFFHDTTGDLATRRVCGVGPIYTLLRALEPLRPAAADVHHYTQHVDPQEGSIVSHASMSFAAPAR